MAHRCTLGYLIKVLHQLGLIRLRCPLALSATAPSSHCLRPQEDEATECVRSGEEVTREAGRPRVPTGGLGNGVCQSGVRK